MARDIHKQDFPGRAITTGSTKEQHPSRRSISAPAPRGYPIASTMPLHMHSDRKPRARTRIAKPDVKHTSKQPALSNEAHTILYPRPPAAAGRDIEAVGTHAAAYPPKMAPGGPPAVDNGNREQNRKVKGTEQEQPQGVITPRSNSGSDCPTQLPDRDDKLDEGCVSNTDPYIPRRSQRLSSLRLSQEDPGQDAVAVAFPELLAKIEGAVCTRHSRIGIWALHLLMVNHPLMYKYFWSSLKEKVKAGDRSIENELLWRKFVELS